MYKDLAYKEHNNNNSSNINQHDLRQNAFTGSI